MSTRETNFLSVQRALSEAGFRRLNSAQEVVVERRFCWETWVGPGGRRFALSWIRNELNGNMELWDVWNPLMDTNCMDTLLAAIRKAVA